MYRNVFILCTGRCGSESFIRACRHIENYTSGHETRVHLLGANRIDYPSEHIEADNRLSWFLGRLDSGFYASDTFFVHLKRNEAQVAQSFSGRSWYQGSITRAYRCGILMLNKDPEADVCLDFVQTVNENIRMFLRDKPHKMSFHLEEARSDFEVFWRCIGARGRFDRAIKEFDKKSNTNQEMEERKRQSSRYGRSNISHIARGFGRRFLR